MVCSTTKLYYHTGTVDATDIGPSTGGALHSITISQPGPNNEGSIIVRECGSSGDIIFRLDDHARNLPLIQVKWEGVRVNGQLNVTLGHANQKVSVELAEG